MSYHVRDVLEAARDEAPAARTTTDDIIRTARRTRARRRTLTGAGVAVALLAVAAGGVTLRGTREAPPVVVTGSAPEGAVSLPDGFRTVLGEYRSGPFRIGPVGQVTETYQQLPVYRDKTLTQDKFPLVDGMITYYRKGGWDPARFTGEKYPVTVAGRPGFARDDKTPKSTRTALAWQYADDAWATYVPEDLRGDVSVEEALAIVTAVRPAAAPTPVRVPYRLGYLPEGWRTVGVRSNPATISSILSETYLYNQRTTAGPVDQLDFVKILVMKGDPKDQRIRGKNGVHCYPNTPNCIVIKDGYLIDVEGRFGKGITKDDVRRIVDGLQLADLTDRATWKPVDK